MKRLFAPLVTLLLVALTFSAVPLAQADEPAPAPVPPTTPPPYTPQTGALFNDPTGTPEQQLVLLNHIMKSIESVPKGSVIRVASYSFTYTPMANALIAAHKRGVQVRVLVDSHTISPEMTKMKKALGSSRSKPSYFATCTYGCMSSKPSFMHSKLYLFSRAGNAKHVSMISSGNPAFAAGTLSWNNTYTIVGDSTLYAANVQNFNDMLKDKTNTKYYRTVTSGPYKEYLFPRAGTTANSDTMYNVLRNVNCTNVAPGYGANGRTVVRIAAYKWTALRAELAQQTTALKKAGCDVEVIYSGDTVEKKIAYELQKQKVPVYDGRLDRDNDGELDLYIHSKYILISGGYAGKNNVKAVYTGSQNFSRNSLRESNETNIRIQLDHVYDQFNANFNYIKTNWTKRVTIAPKPASTVDARRVTTDDGSGRYTPGTTQTKAPLDSTGDDYALDPKE